MVGTIATVRWDRVDPAASVRPRYNHFGSPVWASGDCVPWDPTARGGGELAVVRDLLVALGEQDIELGDLNEGASAALQRLMDAQARTAGGASRGI